VAKLKKSKQEIVKKAEELAVEYEAQFKGCGQCTFLAIIHALRWGGLEVIPEGMDDKFFAGTGGFTGGTALVIDGTCGAIISSMIAMGMVLGAYPGKPERGPFARCLRHDTGRPARQVLSGI